MMRDLAHMMVLPVKDAVSAGKVLVNTVLAPIPGSGLIWVAVDATKHLVGIFWKGVYLPTAGVGKFGDQVISDLMGV